MEKSALRKAMRQAKRQYADQELEDMSKEVAARVLRHPKVTGAQTVLLYYSLPDEVDTHALADQLVATGKTVVLPKIIGDGLLELRRYTGRQDLAEEPSFHILEPIGERFTHYATIDVAIIPGMAFDAQGHRMGRGKGYYDRLLPQLKHTYKIGVCFDFQKVEKVPTEPWDINMDEVL